MDIDRAATTHFESKVQATALKSSEKDLQHASDKTVASFFMI